MNRAYEVPALTEIGSFRRLTTCLWWGKCRDFLGCGRAPICV